MEQAEQAEIRIRNEVFEGTYGSRRKASPFLADFVRETYMPWAKSNKRSWKSDELRCKSLVEHFGSKRLDEITPEMIESYKNARANTVARRGNFLTKTSVNRELEILSKIFTKAIDFDKVDRNPCKRVERFVLRNTRARYFTHAEEERLMKVLTGSLAHIRPVVVVGIGTGLRPPSEIFNLKISDVDFERNVIRAGTKTNEEGEIPMGKEVREVLLELRDRNADSDYLFVSYRTGERFKEIKNGFRKALKLAGIKGACLYTMRHTFGTRLASQGYNAYEIMQLMRHRDIKTSVRYCHTTDGRKRQAVESIWDQSPHKIPTKGEQDAAGL